MQQGFIKEHSQLLAWWLKLSDWLILAIAFWLAMRIGLDTWRISDKYFVALVITSLLSFSVYPFFNVYRAWRGASLLEEFRSLLFAWSSVFALLALLSVFVKVSATYSRLWFGFFYVIGISFLFANRATLRMLLRFVRKNGLNSRQIVIVGTGELAQKVATTLVTAKWAGLEVSGFFSDESSPRINAFLHDIPIIGPLSDCSSYVQKNKVDQVWICMPLSKEGAMKTLFSDMDEVAVDLRFVPDIFGVQLLNHSMTEVAGLPVIDLSASPMEGIRRIIKAIEDKVLAVLILLLISPVLLIIAIGVKISSPGPVIFKQRRFGISGEEIYVYKFRSMRCEDDGAVVHQATKGDSRITAFGGFLRKTSLDELPQFVNVIQGRMSIVGPRPHAVAHNEYYKSLIGGYMKRHLVKPGITGWAQINGWRGETDTIDKMEKRVEHDLYYIENWSLWFDLKIILLTLFKGFSHDNAY